MAVVARRDEEGRAVVEQIVHDGGKAIFVRTDVSVSNDHRNLVEQTVGAFGRLDLAFDNTSTVQFGRSIVELAEEVWDRVSAVSLKGVFLRLKF